MRWIQSPSLSGQLLYIRGAVVILNGVFGRPLLVDYWTDNLSKYTPRDRRVQAYKFIYVVGDPDKKDPEILRCISLRIQEAIKPLFPQSYSCEKSVEVVNMPPLSGVKP